MDDAGKITREEAISGLKEIRDWKGLPYCIEEPLGKQGVAVISTEMIDMAIKALEQEPKTGHWIKHEIKDTCRWLTCSVCGYEWINKPENFCPSCGLRMVESEDKK